MRTLNEIIDDAKNGNIPSHEECYYALLTYEAMFNMDHHELLHTLLSEKDSPEFIRKMKADNSFKMFKNALNKSPKEWLGWDNDPTNPEYQKRRKIGLKILDKVIEQN